MPGSSTFNFGAYAFDGSDLKSGFAKEDLLEQITNISPYDTPFVSQAPKVGCRHIYHQWLQDSLAAIGTEPNALTGAVEGADWSLDTTTTPTRVFNVTMILRKDIGPKGQDYIEDGWFSESGLEVNSPESHLYLKNVQDFTA